MQLADALRISMGIPYFFAPVNFNDNFYVEGEYIEDSHDNETFRIRMKNI